MDSLDAGLPSCPGRSFATAKRTSGQGVKDPISARPGRHRFEALQGFVLGLRNGTLGGGVQLPLVRHPLARSYGNRFERDARVASPYLVKFRALPSIGPVASIFSPVTSAHFCRIVFNEGKM